MTTRTSLRILCPAVAVSSCGLNDDGSRRMESSGTAGSVDVLSYILHTLIAVYHASFKRPTVRHGPVRLCSAFVSLSHQYTAAQNDAVCAQDPAGGVLDPIQHWFVSLLPDPRAQGQE